MTFGVFLIYFVLFDNLKPTFLNTVMLKFIEVKFVRNKPPSKDVRLQLELGVVAYLSHQKPVGERRVGNTEEKLVESALSAGGLGVRR